MNSDPNLNEVESQSIASVEGAVALTLAQARLAAAKLLLSVVGNDQQPVEKERHRLCIDLLKLGVDAPACAEPAPEAPQVRIELIRLLDGTLGASGRAFLMESDPARSSGGAS